MKKRYRVRYYVELGDYAAPKGGTLAPNGVRVSDTDYGYADDLFIVAIVEGKKRTHLCLSTGDEGPPSRQTLLAVREIIDHYLEKHS